MRSWSRTCVVATIDLPRWARAGRGRREHIERVTALLCDWARELKLGKPEAAAWRDAGSWHDALRDASVRELRELVPDLNMPVRVLHGPAAAARLEDDGETRIDVLEAIRWHTLGHPEWTRTGQALYMADFLEPGRRFGEERRAELSREVPKDFAGVLREVVRWRLRRSVERGRPVHPLTLQFWERLR